MVNDEETGYPRHPRFILKQIREGMGFNQTEGGEKLSKQCHWPKGRWANLEKGNQEFKFEFLSEMVDSGVIAENSSEYFDIRAWIDLQEIIQEREELRKANNPPLDPSPKPKPQPEPAPPLRQNKQEEKQPHEPLPEQEEKQPPEPEPSPPPVVTALVPVKTSLPPPERKIEESHQTTSSKRPAMVIGIAITAVALLAIFGALVTDGSPLIGKIYPPTPTTTPVKTPKERVDYFDGFSGGGSLHTGDRLGLTYGTVIFGNVMITSPTSPYTMVPATTLEGDDVEVLVANYAFPDVFEALEPVLYYHAGRDLSDEKVDKLVEYLFKYGCGGDGCEQVVVVGVKTDRIEREVRENPN